MTTSIWHKFYKISHNERMQRLLNHHILTKEQVDHLIQNHALPITLANDMIENAIGTYGLPFGLALNFKINNEERPIPMVVEEPSVIAAASYAAKLVNQSGGFQAKVTQRLMTGELALLNVSTTAQAQALDAYIEKNKQELLAIANEAYPSIVKREGGCRDIRTTYYPKTSDADAFYVIYLTVDTKEAMGANMMNTMLEALKEKLNHHFTAHNQPYDSLMAILSNYATNCLAQAHCRIPARFLAKGNLSGEYVAKRIALASQFAQTDPYRAATHNKGIMNGIDAIIIATGNDWRAIEAAAHAYASRSGQYRGLTTWTYNDTTQELTGEIELPLPVGTIGGSIGIHPDAQMAHQLLKHPDAETLMTIVASVGLAQNLAALRALVSEGIQSGHMQLQAKSLAIQVGATSDEVDAVVEHLLRMAHLNQANAKEALDTIRKQKGNLS